MGNFPLFNAPPPDPALVIKETARTHRNLARRQEINAKLADDEAFRYKRIAEIAIDDQDFDRAFDAHQEYEAQLKLAREHRRQKRVLLQQAMAWEDQSNKTTTDLAAKRGKNAIRRVYGPQRMMHYPQQEVAYQKAMESQKLVHESNLEFGEEYMQDLEEEESMRRAAAMDSPLAQRIAAAREMYLKEQLPEIQSSSSFSNNNIVLPSRKDLDDVATTTTTTRRRKTGHE